MQTKTFIKQYIKKQNCAAWYNTEYNAPYNERNIYL